MNIFRILFSYHIWNFLLQIIRLDQEGIQCRRQFLQKYAELPAGFRKLKPHNLSCYLASMQIFSLHPLSRTQKSCLLSSIMLVGWKPAHLHLKRFRMAGRIKLKWERWKNAWYAPRIRNKLTAPKWLHSLEALWYCKTLESYYLKRQISALVKTALWCTMQN